ncbi:MAG: tyrosine-type recombinase/integrase [Bacillota bacterium]
MNIKKDKKTGKWYFRLDVGSDPKSGKRKQKYRGGFSTKKAAQEELTLIQSKVVDGSYFEPSIEEFDVFFNRWFERTYRRNVEVTTAESRRTVADKHILTYFKQMRLSNIDTLAIDEFYEAKVEEGLSPAYIKIMHSILNQAFKKAVTWKLLKTNPVSDASPPSVKTTKVKALWTKVETKRFLNLVTERNLETPYLLGIFTGMRRGETLGLKWNDIDFESGKVHVQRSLTRTKNDGIVFKSVKTDSSNRIVMISEYVSTLLKGHKKKQDLIKNKLGISYIDNDLVNCTFDGKPIEPRNLLRQFHTLIKQANLPKITFHDLRHLHATTLMSLGENPKIVADRLGHSRVQVTLDYYSHVSSELQKLTAQKFEEDFFNINVQ